MYARLPRPRAVVLFFLSLSLFFPLERQGRKKKGRRRDKKKKNDALAARYEPSFPSASVALLARPARLRTAPRHELIYRSFSSDGVGVYRKHSYTNANIGRRIVDSKD